MYQIGYSLIKNGQELYRGNIPSPYRMSNGDVVYGLEPNVVFEHGVFIPCYQAEVEQPQWCSKIDDIVNITETQVVVTPVYSETPDIVPDLVSMRQARLALLQTGKLAEINSLISTQDEAVQLSWDYSSVVERNNNLIENLSSQIGLTSGELDDLFRLASSL